MKNTTTPLSRRTPARTRHALTLAVLSVLIAGSVFSVATAGSAAAVSVARVTRLAPGDAVIGALPLNQPMPVTVSLKLRNKDALDVFIANIARSQAQHQLPQLMPSGRFLADHAPTAAQAQRVAEYLAGMGYTHIVIAPNRLLITADGTAATARNAFMTSFAQVRTRDGRLTFANTDEVRIPAALADTVQAVIGLQEVHRFHTFEQTGAAPVSLNAGTTAALNPTDFPWAYAATSPVALQIPVGILTSGDLSQVQTALNDFATDNSMQPIVQSVSSPLGRGSDQSHVVQWELDSEAIVGMINGGPGSNTGPAASVIFYNVPLLTDSYVTSGLNDIITDNRTRIIEASIGQCETDAEGDGTAAAQDAIFETAMAQGQTFAIPAGDGPVNDGADQCPAGTAGNTTPSWPASSQYVTAVAGTTLTTVVASGHPAWNLETAWPNSGGSPSSFEPMPAWQSSFGVPGTTRGVPDVAFAAYQGAKVVNGSGGRVTKTGTSLSSALFAGMWARVLAASDQGTGPASPILYALPAADFHDITSGNNGGETAGVGYDFASGRGSMLIGATITDSGSLVNPPPVASFTVAHPTLLTRGYVDHSTDSNGTIVAHQWDFGDGSTSTWTNPIHLYTPGTYTVTETVTDNDGALGKHSQSVTIIPVTQVLVNPGFETGEAPWTIVNFSGGEYSCKDFQNEPVLDGNCIWALVNSKGANEALTQEVKIPAGMTQATLSAYIWVRNFNTQGPTPGAENGMSVQIRQPNGVLFKTLQKFSSLDGDESCTTACAVDYVQYTYDVSQWIGKSIGVEFYMDKFDSQHHRNTTYMIDDVTLIVK